MNKEEIGIKTPEYISLQFQLAGLGSRAVAYIIDYLILSFINVILFVVAIFLIIATPSIEMFIEANSYIIALLLIGLFLLNYGYFFVLEFFWGGKTIGKRIMGIRVIQDNGHSITFFGALIRNLLRLIDSLPAYNLLGILMIYFHSRKKRLGDLLAGTIVVYDETAKRNQQFSKLEQEIANRGLTKESIQFEKWNLASFEMKDWNLIRTFCGRYLQLDPNEKHTLTKQVAEIIFPKIGYEVEGKSIQEIENILFVLYLNLKEEWEYELK